MNSPSHSRVGAARYLRTPVLFLLTLSLAVLGFAAEGVRKNFAVPADEAAKALKQFAAQSGEQLLYSPSDVAGVKTLAIKGELTAREALEKMLEGTTLVVAQDKSTGALAVRKETAGEAKNGAGRLADAMAAGAKVKDGVLQLDAFQVTERRVDGLINNGLLQGGAQAPLYHSVIDQAEIERLGVTSIEELFRLIPQTSSSITSLQTLDSSTSSGGGLSSRFSTTSLRGFGSAQTVILINGRALPRSGRSSNGGADLNRIPLAAIQRVEIMPYAGSAVYGSGSIGGAINIILKKDYSGRDLTAYVGTTTEGGGTEFRFTWLEGRTFNRGRTSLTLTLNYQHRDPILAEQRGFLDQLIAKYPVGSANWFTFVLPSLSSSPPVFLTSSASGLGIPGAGATRYAMLPAGTSLADAPALTPASFTATAGMTQPTERAGKTVLYVPQDTSNVNAQIEHKFVPEKLEGYAELTYGYTRQVTHFPQSTSLTLSATDPLNPFRTNVTPGFSGRSVTVIFDPPDLPLSTGIYEWANARAVFGLKGIVTPRLEWSVDGSVDHSDSTVYSNNPADAVIKLNGLTVSGANPGPAAAAATRRAVYPLLVDHGAYPNPASDADKYFTSARNSYTRGTQYEYNGRVTGDVYGLPAGWLKASGFLRYRDFHLRSGQYFTGADAYSQLINNGPFPRNETGSISDRRTWQGAVEMVVPVIGKAWRPLPIDELTFNLSAGHERNVTDGSDSFYSVTFPQLRTQADTYVAAVKLQVVPDFALRASYSDAVAVPDWDQTGTPPQSFASLPFLVDPLRGNTIQSAGFNSIFGGSPGLLSERAKSKNFGVILKPRLLKGLTITVDAWEIRKRDAIDTPSPDLMLARPQDYPGRIVRADPTPADLALGWQGILLSVDTTYINVGKVRTNGIDTRLDYVWDTRTLGTFNFVGNASYTAHYISQQAPGTPEIERSGALGAPLHWRGYGMVRWARNAFSASVTARYVDHYYASTTAKSPSFPNATGVDGGRIPAFVHYDLQFGFDVPYRSDRRGWSRWFNGTKWTVGALNVLNEAPTFMTAQSTATALSSFYNRYDDVRQRFVYTQVKKSF